MQNVQVSLNKNYRHICLDLETTWLDKDKDSIIQIGIIEIDHHAGIVNHFCSYTNPGTDASKLSETVSHLTNIKQEDLLAAPSIDQIVKHIEKYFGNDVVIVWHNISFDIWFLEKNFPSLCRSHTIDTFDIIWSNIPYLKSYALENIHSHLLSHEKSYKTIYHLGQESITSWRNQEQSHDALYDSLLCCCIIQRRIIHLVTIFDKFPYLVRLYDKVDNGYIEIIKSDWYHNEEWSIPRIERPTSKDRKNHSENKINKLFEWQWKKISMKWMNIKELIDKLPQPSIIAVSHPSKIDIIKNACPWYNFDYLKENQVIDFTLYEKRIQKKNLSMSEWLFCLLYLSHTSLWYSVIQATLTEHKHILSYITVREKERTYNNHILCTHGWWYAYRDQHNDRSEELGDYTICMRDIDRWYITYNDYSSRYFNPQSLLFGRDELLYKKLNDSVISPNWCEDREKYEEIYNNLLMFLWIFSIECNTIREKRKNNKREWICSNNDDYGRSIWLWDTIYTWRKELCHGEEQWSYLDKTMEKMNKLLFQESLIQYNQSMGKSAYYTLTPLHKYIDFSEYNDLFGRHKYCFLSTHRAEYESLTEGKESVSRINKDISIKSLQSIQDIEREIITAWSKNIFIISHNGEKSKQIFAHIRKQAYMNNKEILAEYITGWIQKNVAKGETRTEKSLLMIGGYHYLLNIRSSKIKVENIIIYHIAKQREPFIYNDILRYAPL